MVGVMIVSLSRTALATDISVSARVAGTPPPSAAVITSPLNGAQLSSWILPVTGVCPPATIIELYSNNVFIGSAFCSATGTFALQADLFWGENQLQTHIFNLGDTVGPNSPVVDVFLNKPSLSSTTSAMGQRTPIPSSNINNSAPPPLLLQTNTSFREYSTNEAVSWTITVNGGVPPYAIAVDWGDGNTSLTSVRQPGLFVIKQAYKHAGGYHGEYTIKIRASDSAGQQAYMQLFVLVNNNLGDGGLASSNKAGPASNFGSGFRLSTGVILKTAWSIYGVIVLMTLSFWLGERRGGSLLSNQSKPVKLRAHHI